MGQLRRVVQTDQLEQMTETSQDGSMTTTSRTKQVDKRDKKGKTHDQDGPAWADSRSDLALAHDREGQFQVHGWDGCAGPTVKTT